MIYFVGFYAVLVSLLAFIRDRRKAMILAGSWMFVFSALRWNAGNDYLSYYDQITKGLISRYEFISQPLMHLAGLTHPQVFFVVTSAVICGFQIATLLEVNKREGVSRLAILAFASFPAMYLESFGYARQFCASSILIYAFVRRDKPVIGVLLAVLASGFHSGAALFALIFAVLAIWRIRVTPVVYILGLIGAALSTEMLRYMSDLLGFYSHYFSNHVASHGRPTAIFYVALLLAMLIWPYKQKFQTLRGEFNVFYVGVCLMVALVPYGSQIARGSWWAIGFAPILVGYLVARSGPGVRVLCAVVCCVLFFYHVHLATNNKTWDFLGGYTPIFMVSPSEIELTMSDYLKTR